MKKWYQSKLIWAGVTAVLTAVIGTASCGGMLDKIPTDQAVDTLRQCSLSCGADIVKEGLSCPITGNEIKDVLTVEKAKGLKDTAVACIEDCLLNRGVEVLTEVCK